MILTNGLKVIIPGTNCSTAACNTSQNYKGISNFKIPKDFNIPRFRFFSKKL